MGVLHAFEAKVDVGGSWNGFNPHSTAGVEMRAAALLYLEWPGTSALNGVVCCAAFQMCVERLVDLSVLDCFFKVFTEETTY